MSDEHLDNLRQARAQLIEQRARICPRARRPLRPRQDRTGPRRVMETQAAIEAMDRAIEDEEGTRRAVYDRS